VLNPSSETSLQAVEVCSDKAKAGTFINNRDNQLLAGTNKKISEYAGSNRDKNKWSCHNYEGASKLLY